MPANEPASAPSAKQLYGYNLMGGDPHRTFGVGGSMTMSGFERIVRGWVQPQTLTSSQNGVQITDLYTTGDIYEVALASGWSVLMSNHQRVSYFDQLHTDYCYNTCGAPTTTLHEGLMTTGLNVTLRRNVNSNLDVLPADNTLIHSLDNQAYQGDLYGPGTRTQITPWTRPNINGYTSYANTSSGFVMDWQAVDNIRYTGGANNEMAFDYIENFRTSPTIRADSWIGSETAEQTLGAMLVTNGADLDIDVGAGNSLAFNGSLTIQNGSTLTIRSGTIEFADNADLIVNSGGSLTIEPGVTLRFGTGDLLPII